MVQKSVSFNGHISDGLSVLSVRSKPHKGYVTERVLELSGIVPKLGSRGIENLFTEVTASAKRHPGGTLPLP